MLVFYKSFGPLCWHVIWYCIMVFDMASRHTKVTWCVAINATCVILICVYGLLVEMLSIFFLKIVEFCTD